MANPVITLSIAREIDRISRLVIKATEEGAPDDLLSILFQRLNNAIPDGHVLRAAVELHDRPNLWEVGAIAISRLAYNEANGQDITIGGASPEVQAAIDRYTVG